MGNNVNHPEHYNAGGYECIDVMEANFGKDKVQDFCLLNAFKYLWRADKKSGLEDIKKANWYLGRYLTLENGEKHYIMEAKPHNAGKIGFWKKVWGGVRCSVCGKTITDCGGWDEDEWQLWNFCPNCGALMVPTQEGTLAGNNEEET